MSHSNTQERTMKLKSSFCLAVALLVAAATAAPLHLRAQAGTIKIGVLHSLSGTMAISETTLKDTILMMIEDQNKKGGLLGKKLEAVVVDPASNWPLFAGKGQGRSRVWVLDFSFQKVGTSCFREEQRIALLSRPVRRRRVLEECDL